jgi:hypothetical protein
MSTAIDNNMPEKRERTPAQIAAFQKAKEVRESNLRKKWEQENQQSKESTQPSQVQVKQEDDDAHAEDDMETEQVEEAPTPPQPQPRQQPLHPVEQQNDYMEIDADELFGQLNQYKQDIEELRCEVHGLRQGHETLQTDWHNYGEKRKCEINFV